MKKLFSLLTLLAFMATVGMAQVPATKATSGKTAVQTKTTAAPVKKDGTPDKRYKANQQPKPAVAGPLKKDGTPDMRYKNNKTTKPQ